MAQEDEALGWAILISNYSYYIRLYTLINILLIINYL